MWGGEVSCVVPFYNEGERILNVLEVITKVKEIGEIICVDDGSSDDAYHYINEKWPTVKILRLNKNHGKAQAVEKGIRAAKHEIIFLIDADLQNLSKLEVENAIKAVYSENFDMVILRRINSYWYLKFSRIDILLSGERILKKTDLLKILEKNVDNYRLEIAINCYMQKYRKKVRWVPWSATNTYKMQKLGMIEGLKQEIRMFTDILSYVGISEFSRQLFSFCRKKIGTPENTAYYRIMNSMNSVKKNKVSQAKGPLNL
jgi:glycosyltransferase involved in cell wall biosynthesis